jgi:hypothetical protein
VLFTVRGRWRFRPALSLFPNLIKYIELSRSAAGGKCERAVSRRLSP